ncbi:hypothetical protein DMB92_06885 [Campylobacter sp. MIT 99-7217]|uniref:C40 family peptidase n=1 Tax=Campylobacter sp. MIT 99-7217 TaxID=535091 RepID=UPI001157ADF7|nr:C40 family peptidase [Campylobacter sp. MIT 99-7217]TQR30942.1 hypothetical protein DMB92_06885 [Campylobacter sp. MIT 99-7217]
MKYLKIFSLLIVLFIFNACSTKTHKISYPKTNVSSSQLAQIQKQWQRTPYVLGGTSRTKGADCSGFTQSALKNFNTKIPRTTKMQMQSGIKVSKKNLRSGDLVFFKTGRGPNGLHVGIYTKADKFIHLSPKGGVREASLNNSYWKPKYLGARRYIK